MHQRNHRRIVTIDGKVSYIGGFNIGKEYLGQNPKFGPWRDYHVRVKGMVPRIWKENSLLTGKKIREKKMPVHESLPAIGNVKYQYLFSDGKGLWEKYGALIKQAKNL